MDALVVVSQNRIWPHSEWIWSGYSEIQAPRRKKKLISYNKLSELAGFDSYKKF